MQSENSNFRASTESILSNNDLGRATLVRARITAGRCKEVRQHDPWLLNRRRQSRNALSYLLGRCLMPDNRPQTWL